MSLDKRNTSSLIPVSVVLSVKNEEKNLPVCLEQLEEFAEVIVVDSNSTDRTPEIVRSFGFQLVNFDWDGMFPKKRNWALRNLKLKNDWVLFIDADEVMTSAFKKELAEKVQNLDINGYWLLYQNYFAGRPLKHGDTMRKLALFRIGCGEYERIEEDSWSHLDMEIHEHPIVEGSIGSIDALVIHNDYKGYEAYISRHNAYSTWEANRYLSLKRSGFESLNFRQKIKYRLLDSWFLGPVYFFGAYVLKAGFLDGTAGYLLAMNKMAYFFQIKIKIDELKRSENNEV